MPKSRPFIQRTTLANKKFMMIDKNPINLQKAMDRLISGNTVLLVLSSEYSAENCHHLSNKLKKGITLSEYDLKDVVEKILHSGMSFSEAKRQSLEKYLNMAKE